MTAAAIILGVVGLGLGLAYLGPSPLMLRRTHRRLYIRQGENYRWQLEAARHDKEVLERRHQRLLETLHGRPGIQHTFEPGHRRRHLVVPIADVPASPELAQLLAESIVRALLAPRVVDDRPDLRTPERRQLL